MTETVTGTIKNFSPKPDEDYYGLLVEVDGEEDWYNGSGNPEDEWEKGDTIEFEYDTSKFIDMTDVSIVEESGGPAGPNTGSRDEGGSGDSSPTLSRKDKRILVQVAFKEARKASTMHPVEHQGQHLDEVSELVNGYYNLLEAQIKDKVTEQ